MRIPGRVGEGAWPPGSWSSSSCVGRGWGAGGIERDYFKRPSAGAFLGVMGFARVNPFVFETHTT